MVEFGLCYLCMHWLHLVITYPNYCSEYGYSYTGYGIWDLRPGWHMNGPWRFPEDAIINIVSLLLQPLVARLGQRTVRCNTMAEYVPGTKLIPC